MNNLFIAVAFFIITIVTALFAVPYFIDWNGYRGVFEEEASRLLGREVRVGGAVNLHLLPTPYFRFEKVRIGDTSANLQEPFFRTDSLTIKLSIPPMFRGVVEANEIELQKPVLRLAPDEGEAWNWQSFGQALSSATYLPSNVALTSLRITDGVLAVHGADGVERMRLERFNGELSAPALAGPYRFRGRFGKPKAERELRIATAEPDADGGVRFKASLRLGEVGSTYLLDARLIDAMGKPRVEGELNARLPIVGLWQRASQRDGHASAQAPLEDEVRVDRGEAGFDLKAGVTANAAGARLSNVSLAFEQDGRPQLVTGEVRADWRDALTVDMKLASSWLDLDRIAGAPDGAGPIDSIATFATRLQDLLPGAGRSRAALSVTQANLGREAVSGVRLSLARTKDGLEIEELRLGMPGGGRGELRGLLTDLQETPAFEGSLALQGSSLARFFSWASGGMLPVDAKWDGSFGMRAQLSITGRRIAAQDIVGDLSGTAVHGSGHYIWEGRPQISLALESPQLDARALIPEGVSLAGALDLLKHGPVHKQASGSGGAPLKPSWRGAQTDAVIRVNAGQLVTASRTYRDVAMEIEFVGGNLKLPLLKVAGDEGFTLELEGNVEDVAIRPKGSLRGVATAEVAGGIAALAELLGIPDAFRPDPERAQALSPLRIAGSIGFGARAATSADILLDGEANGASVKLGARLDGGLGGWRQGQAELTVAMDAADASKIAAVALSPGEGARAGDSSGPGRLLMKAAGVPTDGMTSLAFVNAGDVALGFRGELIAAENAIKASGDVELKGADAARVAGLAGLAPPLRLEGLPISGNMQVSAGAGSTKLEKLALKIGGSDIRGQLSLSRVGERRRVDGEVELEELSLPKLLSPLLDQRLAGVSAAEAVLSGRQSPWPDEPFDLTSLAGLEGQVRITSKRLTLADGLGLDQARVDLALDGSKIEVKEIAGGALGGLFSATAKIDKAPAGVEMSGAARLVGGALETYSEGVGASRAIGSVSGSMEFSGRGRSPRALVSALQGSGVIELGDTKLPNVWPGAIAKAVEAALKVEPERLGSALKEGLVSALSGGLLPLGPQSVGLEIADGQVRTKELAVETDAGGAAAAVNVDLRSFSFEAEWRLEQKPAGGGAPLPPVTLAFRGPVASFAGVERRINSDALEREVSVRRMEQDVDELERLRRLDEQRRRTENDRSRDQQGVRPPSATPVAPPVSAPGARPAGPG